MTNSITNTIAHNTNALSTPDQRQQNKNSTSLIPPAKEASLCNNTAIAPHTTIKQSPRLLENAASKNANPGNHSTDLSRAQTNLDTKKDFMGNEYIELHAGFKLYRGDDHFNPQKNDYTPQFFALHLGNAAQYSRDHGVIIECTLQQTLKLIKFDGSISHFYKTLSENEQSVIERNFGINAQNAHDSENAAQRVRTSISATDDSKIFQSIATYQPKGLPQPYDGYIISQPIAKKSSYDPFHPEAGICTSSTIVYKLISGQSDKQLSIINAKAEKQALERAARPAGKPSRSEALANGHLETDSNAPHDPYDRIESPCRALFQ